METSYLKTLELDKIIARAAEGCVCKEARAMLLAIEPQCDPDEVRYALEQTDAINTLLIKNGSPRFGGVEGVSQLAARAVKGGVLSMGELLMVAGALRNFQHLTSWYGSSEHDALPTDDLFYALAPEPGLEQQISSAILAPDAMADTASRTLAELRKKIRATENSIRDRLESMVRNMDTSKYLQESVVSMRNGRYVVPVKSEYRGEVSGIIHDVSSTGATVFVEPQAVVEANARILQYRAQEAQEIERILVAFTAQVAAIEPQFQYSYQAMLDIDVLLAKARLALELKGCHLCGKGHQNALDLLRFLGTILQDAGIGFHDSLRFHKHRCTGRGNVMDDAAHFAAVFALDRDNVAAVAHGDHTLLQIF